MPIILALTGKSQNKQILSLKGGVGPLMRSSMEGIHKVVYDYDSRYVSKRNIHKLGQKNQLLNEYLYEDQTYEYKPTFSSNASIRT